MMQQEEASFGGRCVTFPVGPSLCKRGCLSRFDAPSPMYPLPAYS